MYHRAMQHRERSDKNVKITAGKKLSGTESFPVYVQKKHTV